MRLEITKDSAGEVSLGWVGVDGTEAFSLQNAPGKVQFAKAAWWGRGGGEGGEVASV